ncbi:MAG: FAD-dependent oxidoreductase, partial [bacterium]
TPDVYCVPHYPDRFLLGATMEEKGFERRVRAGGAYDLLFAAAEVLPAIKNQPFLETWVGHRPASRDSKPVIGPSAVTENLYFATGHYRNGILLTPITAKWIHQCIVDKTLPVGIEPFLPVRFSKKNY